MSVDPLADKYPGISPYAYCAWNPIKYVDPDGRKIVVQGRNIIEKFAAKLGFSIGYVKKVENDLAQLKLDNKEVGGMITALEESDNTHVIQFPKRTWNKCGAVGEKNGSAGRGSIVDYDPDNTKTVNGDTRTPRASLAHELTHSMDFDTGNETNQEIDGVRVMEFKAIDMENKVRNVTGDKKRTTYGGKDVSKYIE